MTIISAKFANPEETCVALKTGEAGEVIIQLPPLSDISGGWQPEYIRWSQHGGHTSPYVESFPVESAETFAASQGYGIFALLDLLDMERKLDASQIPMPPKATAVRAWVDSVRLAFATSQQPQPAPFTYSEVAQEVLVLLTP
jgi:hypothetical protein